MSTADNSIAHQRLIGLDTRRAQKAKVNWLQVLPRELRDIIYEHALSEEGGLIADLTRINDPGQALQLYAKSAVDKK